MGALRRQLSAPSPAAPLKCRAAEGQCHCPTLFVAVTLSFLSGGIRTTCITERLVISYLVMLVFMFVSSALLNLKYILAWRKLLSLHLKCLLSRSILVSALVPKMKLTLNKELVVNK